MGGIKNETMQHSALARDHPSRLTQAARRVLKRVAHLRLLMSDSARTRAGDELIHKAVFALLKARARLRRLKANGRQQTAKDKLRKSPHASKKRNMTVCYARNS